MGWSFYVTIIVVFFFQLGWKDFSMYWRGEGANAPIPQVWKEEGHFFNSLVFKNGTVVKFCPTPHFHYSTGMYAKWQANQLAIRRTLLCSLCLSISPFIMQLAGVSSRLQGNVLFPHVIAPSLQEHLLHSLAWRPLPGIGTLSPWRTWMLTPLRLTEQLRKPE